jgi:uncharacterized protein (TIGR02145 family)
MKNYLFLILIPILFSCQDDIIDENPGGYTFSQGNGVFFDGHQYSSVVYGNGQEWMTENLKTAIFSNGDSLSRKDGNQWIQVWIVGGPTYTIYNGDDESLSSYDSYGYLYNFEAVSDPRNICPQGWHVPTLQEWESLVNYLGGSQIAGSIMTSRTTDYLSQFGEGVWPGEAECCPFGNESGFSALPNGKIVDNGEAYFGLGIDTFSYSMGWTLTPPHYKGVDIYPNPNQMINPTQIASSWWWTSSTNQNGWPKKCLINWNSPEVVFESNNQNTGICIRCLMD